MTQGVLGRLIKITQRVGGHLVLTTQGVGGHLKTMSKGDKCHPITVTQGGGGRLKTVTQAAGGHLITVTHGGHLPMTREGGDHLTENGIRPSRETGWDLDPLAPTVVIQAFPHLRSVVVQILLNHSSTGRKLRPGFCLPVGALTFIFLLRYHQCCGSVTFWYGSGCGSLRPKNKWILRVRI